jgi:hypothetical protein
MGSCSCLDIVGKRIILPLSGIEPQPVARGYTELSRLIMGTSRVYCYGFCIKLSLQNSTSLSRAYSVTCDFKLALWGYNVGLSRRINEGLYVQTVAREEERQIAP